MPTFRSVAVATAALVALASATPIEKRQSACFEGPYVIYARGTDPSQVPSTTNDPDPTDSVLAGIASSGIPSATTIQPLQYPAAGLNPPNYQDYTTSWGIGIDHLQGNITYYVDNCPGSKIVLLGYSQGASIITGALFGGQGRPSLSQQYIDAIAGGVAIADPSYVTGLPNLDKGSTATNNGVYQDGSVQTDLNTALGDVFRSYCAAGDKLCDSGSDDSIHGNEQSIWQQTAIDFLQSLTY